MSLGTPVGEMAVFAALEARHLVQILERLFAARFAVGRVEPAVAAVSVSVAIAVVAVAEGLVLVQDLLPHLRGHFVALAHLENEKKIIFNDSVKPWFYSRFIFRVGNFGD